jgi:ABC-2 type transport system permease protein
VTQASDTLAPLGPEIPRPSAFGGGWRRFWQLLWLTATADFKQRYAHSSFGYLWTLIQPLALFAILYVVVTEIVFRFRGEVQNFGVLLLFNIVLFQFFATSAARSIPALTRRAGLVQRLAIPRVVMPLSTVLTVGFALGIDLVLVIVWILASGIEPTWTWLLMPVILAYLIVLTCGICLLLSALYVRHRDVQEGWPVISRVLFYASPILFPIELLPAALLDAQSFNPLAPMLTEARVWIIDPDAPGWFSAGLSPFQELMPFAILIAICIGGWVVFARKARRMAEEL